jgi:hypothetical protein
MTFVMITSMLVMTLYRYKLITRGDNQRKVGDNQRKAPLFQRYDAPNTTRPAMHRAKGGKRELALLLVHGRLARRRAQLAHPTRLGPSPWPLPCGELYSPGSTRRRDSRPPASTRTPRQ